MTQKKKKQEISSYKLFKLRHSAAILVAGLQDAHLRKPLNMADRGQLIAALQNDHGLPESNCRRALAKALQHGRQKRLAMTEEAARKIDYELPTDSDEPLIIRGKTYTSIYLQWDEAKFVEDMKEEYGGTNNLFRKGLHLLMANHNCSPRHPFNTTHRKAAKK